jgi:hypothetical protein
MSVEPFANYLDYIGAKLRINVLRSYDLNGGEDDLREELAELESKCDEYLNWAISPSNIQGEDDNG